ncbi:MAG TPA: lysophospholipid acyltransferase family protein [Kouleothrix sp.]|uniref:lysophospholipid acyltransferase family protein n=1 Tax=Kouleothrix sp. TaxID=2779161 RepID=UPI002CFEEBC2|nr:lysophospholipid acyltransferase family protein [Kouleothrix sp.]HRC77438.1 lysophospholipid acyltransferase family protein [Kouleothrix sp.]
MGLYTSRHPIARIGLPSRLFLAFVRFYCRLEVDGIEHLPSSGAFVLAANHASHADTAVIFAALPRALRARVVAAAAQDYFFDNGFRQFISRVLFNTIPVPRKVTPSSDPLRHVVRALREGYGVLLYPEGTRSRNGDLGPFRSGVGRIAAEFPDVPIIPVWLGGTARVLPKNGLPIPRPVKVHVRFGEPLKSERAWLANKANWKVLAGHVRDAVARLRR